MKLSERFDAMAQLAREQACRCLLWISRESRGQISEFWDTGCSIALLAFVTGITIAAVAFQRGWV